MNIGKNDNHKAAVDGYVCDYLLCLCPGRQLNFIHLGKEGYLGTHLWCLGRGGEAEIGIDHHLVLMKMRMRRRLRNKVSPAEGQG